MKPTNLPSLRSLEEWTRSNLVRKLIIISPHLDDAGFSVPGIICAAPVPVHVHTVFTAADGNSDSTWARATGFRDAFDEYEHRRKEDIVAMQALGAEFSHGGVAYCDLSDSAALATADAVRALADGVKALVLLPLGAGSKRGFGLHKNLHRMLGRPIGAPIHEDHIWVRNIVRDAMRESSNVLIGYFPELPYLWANMSFELSQRATKMIDGAFERIVFASNVKLKMEIAALYKSQVNFILGQSLSYRRKACSAPELLFLPKH